MTSEMTYTVSSGTLNSTIPYHCQKSYVDEGSMHVVKFINCIYCVQQVTVIVHSTQFLWGTFHGQQLKTRWLNFSKAAHKYDCL